MPVPILVSRKDTLSVVSPFDGSIDHARILDVDGSVPEWWTRYSRGEPDALDADRIPTLDEAEPPTRFEVRALTARERRLVYSLTTPDPDDHPEWEADSELRGLVASARIDYAVRLGLASITQAGERVELPCRRSRSWGVTMWDVGLLDALDPHTLGWLGMVVLRLSTVPFDRSAPSGS